MSRAAYGEMKRLASEPRGSLPTHSAHPRSLSMPRENTKASVFDIFNTANNNPNNPNSIAAANGAAKAPLKRSRSRAQVLGSKLRHAAVLGKLGRKLRRVDGPGEPGGQTRRGSLVDTSKPPPLAKQDSKPSLKKRLSMGSGLVRKPSMGSGLVRKLTNHNLRKGNNNNNNNNNKVGACAWLAKDDNVDKADSDPQPPEDEFSDNDPAPPPEPQQPHDHHQPHLDLDRVRAQLLRLRSCQRAVHAAIQPTAPHVQPAAAAASPPALHLCSPQPAPSSPAPCRSPSRPLRHDAAKEKCDQLARHPWAAYMLEQQQEEEDDGFDTWSLADAYIPASEAGLSNGKR